MGQLDLVWDPSQPWSDLSGTSSADQDTAKGTEAPEQQGA